MKPTLAIALLTLPLLACTSTSGSTAEPASSSLERIAVSTDRVLPIYRNVPLNELNPGITQAVIVVHAADRDADRYFADTMAAATALGVDDTTAVVAPHFSCGDDAPPAGDAYWRCSGADWSHGFDDISGAATPISSYAVVDQLVGALAAKTTFPNLTRIVITGMGSGGQLAQRYAATNPIDPVTGVAIRYVVLAPSSYVYLDAQRPAATCAGYNDYFYGLDSRTGYVARPSVAAIQQQFVARDVAYLVGANDTLANAAPTDMDTSCQANAQGVDRLERATKFAAIMREVYGATQAMTVVPACGSSRSCMFASAEVRAALFGP